MRSLLSHANAFRALFENPKDVAAAQRVYDLALSDPPGAQQVLVWLTEDFFTRERFIPDVRVATVAEFSRARELTIDIDESPRSLEDLVRLMERAGSQWRTIKAVGAGYAFSNIDDTDGYHVFLTRFLNRILPIDSSVLKDPSATNLCRFEGGTTIDTLTSYLWANNKALLNQPGFEGLSFVGVMASGGHGSGVRLGPLSEAVRSLYILTFDADHNVVQKLIEPSMGITDSDAFSTAYPDIELIQDDQAFHAATVSIGCMGIIYSAIIEVQDAFYLREDRFLTTWEAVKSDLPALLDDHDLHSFHIWLNPYKTENKQDCVVSLYRHASGPPHGKRGIGIRLGGLQSIVDIMLFLVKHFPQSTPGLISASLNATTAEDVVMPCWEALNFGPPNMLKCTATDYGVAVEDTILAADRLSQAFADLAAQNSIYLLSPFGLRFVRRAEALMSPMYGRDTCMIEMPMLDGLPRRRKLFHTFVDALAPLNARPHWGQRNVADANSVELLFPRFHEFKDQVHLFNVARLFDNSFTRQLNL